MLFCKHSTHVNKATQYPNEETYKDHKLARVHNLNEETYPKQNILLTESICSLEENIYIKYAQLTIIRTTNMRLVNFFYIQKERTYTTNKYIQYIV